MESAFGYLGLGTGGYLGLYFGGMVAASLYDLIRRRNDPYYVSIGASGAVSAVLFTSIFLAKPTPRKPSPSASKGGSWSGSPKKTANFAAD